MAVTEDCISGSAFQFPTGRCPRWLLFGFLGFMVGCGQTTTDGNGPLIVHEDTGFVPVDEIPGSEAGEETGSTGGEEVGGEETGGEPRLEPGSTQAPSAGSPDGAWAPTPDVASTGEAVEGGILAHPSAFEGTFVYGISAEQGTPLTQIGGSTAGFVALPAVYDLGEDVATIRVLDVGSGQPVPGEEGVLESFPLIHEEDGSVRILLGEPTDGISFALGQNCVYASESFSLVSPPVYDGGLLTWTGEETFVPKKCGGWGIAPTSGVNVHFMRRVGANPLFEPRTADAGSPLGFFRASSSPDVLNRMPWIGSDMPDGRLNYFIGPSFPESLRPTVLAVFEDWNDVIEEAVGNRPFTVEDAPEGMLAWDPRHRFLSWDDSESLGAVAPFIEDPFTGELFGTWVIFWLGDFEGLMDKYVLWLEKHPDAPFAPFEPEATLKLALPELAKDLPPRVLRRRVLHRRDFDFREVRELSERLGKSLEGDELAEYILADFLSHELGHNLGLRHNFKGSLDFDQQTEEVPSSTVMDYILGMPKPGSYDHAAMRYAYGDGEGESAFLYCSDEHLELDPGCAQHDVGHPIEYYLAFLERLSEEIPVDQSYSDIQWQAEEAEWGKVFLRIRQFVNTDYEQFHLEEPLSVFQELLDRVLCSEDCGTHPWLRSEWALQLLYTKHVVTEYWEPGAPTNWHDLPSLNEEQAAMLMDAFFAFVVDPEQSPDVKSTIIGKLPTANVAGASDLLLALKGWLESIEVLDSSEEQVLEWIDEALQAG